MFYYRLFLVRVIHSFTKLSDYTLSFEFQLKWHNEWSIYLDLPFHLAKVLIKAAFQQKFLRRHKRRPDFVRFWCSSFGYSMQQLFIIKQKGNAEYKPHLLIFYTFLLSIYICWIYGTPVSKGTLVGFIYTFWYSLWPTSSILE